MKKKTASQSAFFNLRILTGLFLVMAGLSLGVLGFGGFSAQAQQKQSPILKSSDPLAPGPIDCSRIRDFGIDRQENLRAGYIMIYCGLSPGGHPDPDFGTKSLVQQIIEPDNFGGTDVDLVTGADTAPHVIQSETYTSANPDNPNQVVVAYNDSRGASTNYSGASVSTDGGATFTRLTTGSGQSPFASTFGDPVAIYNRPSATWFTVWLDAGCGGQGLGGYKSTNPIDPNSWTHYCIHTASSDDRESGWSDTNPSSPFYGRMYVSWNDFNVASGALFVTHSTDNGVTWSAGVQLTAGFTRDVQITGDYANGNVYLAAMNENGGGFPHNDNNIIYKSTDGGVTFNNTYTGPAFAGPGVTAVGYFACMFPDNGGFWRHEGWGEPAAFNNIVSLVYAQQGGTGDAGDVYYIRSTDGGVNFSAPFKLNSDSTTRPQWQPNISVSPAGTLLATWYDGRDSTSCTMGNSAVPCYRMYSRKSNDNGATWLPDMPMSDVVSPLPGQSDSAIQPTYAGDYDYGSALVTKHLTSWTDGRVAIGGASQQDTFTDKELVGFSVTSSNPACSGVVSTAPTDFVINVTDPVNVGTLTASDFAVNGTPANSVNYTAGQTVMTFHFNSTPVVTQGLQTMHIAAGAFTRTTDGQGIFDFTCTFRYDAVLLQVTTTVPAVNGTFTPDAPNTYNYDVNFNEAVDPSSVQAADLTVSGNSAPSVTGVTVLAGNTTARFTVNCLFGGVLTANIAAGAVTDAFGNPNLAFSGSYSVSGCPPQNHYNIAQIGGSIVPGTVDIGNHIDDGVTTIALPFTYTLYDMSFNNITLSSNGNAQFTTSDIAYSNICLPWTTHNYTIYPYWDDLYTVNAGFGIFTSISGSSPNRVFNIEWRNQYFPGSGTANFELRLYEGQARFDVIYGTLTNGNTSATAGVQRDDTSFDQYFCNGTGGAATGGQSYTLAFCGTPSPTPTATATFTGTPSPTPTATATATSTATATATATFTPIATPCGNYTFTTGTGAIVPGTTDTGNHSDDGTTAISLPFPFSFYGNFFTTANVSSNGNLQFTSSNTAFTNNCIPDATMNNLIAPHWDDLRTDTPAGSGIFTSVSGSTPNRIFNIEWRASYFSGGLAIGFEIRLYETTGQIDFVYGTLNGTGSSATVGLQAGTGSVVNQFSCNTASLSDGFKISATFASSCTPAPTPTSTATATASPTPTATATFTPTVTPTSTFTPSATATATVGASPCANYSYTISTGTIVPGTTDTTNHIDDGSTSITLPFSYTLYDQTFTTALVGSNGHLTFGAVNDGYNANCLPQTTTTYAIFPYRTDLCTNACTGNTGTSYGIFTSVSGSTPNRIFNIEYREAYYNSTDTTVNFEVRLYEGQTAFDVVYGTINPLATVNDGPLSVGVQHDSSILYTLVACDPTGGQNPPVSTGQLYHWTLGCLPTPTPTPSSSPTYSISGTVGQCNTTGPSGILLPGVTMTMTGAASGSTTTDASGNYSFSGLFSGNYTLTPSKAARAPGSAGINTTDVIAVQRHFLLISLLTGCRLTAADTATPFGTINTADVIAVQRFFLVQSTGIGRAGQYGFNPVNRAYTPLSTSQVAQNYDTVVYGDVATPFAFPRGTEPPPAEAPTQVTVDAVTLPPVPTSTRNVNAPVTTTVIDAASNIVGFQGDFTFDERAVRFDDNPVEKAGLTAGNWNVSGNVLPGNGPIRTVRVSAFSNDFAPLSGSGTLFELKMRRVARGSTRLNWAPSPDQFIFIDAELNTRTVGNVASGASE